MAANTRAPKQWQLTKTETVSSFESWRQNLLYILTLDRNFELFLKPGTTWTKEAVNEKRGLLMTLNQFLKTRGSQLKENAHS
jgi:hypothetical protein